MQNQKNPRPYPHKKDEFINNDYSSTNIVNNQNQYQYTQNINNEYNKNNNWDYNIHYNPHQNQKNNHNLTETPIKQPESEFFIDEKEFGDLNFFLIGFRLDFEGYFSVLLENFKFLKPINSEFKDVNDFKTIKKPCLAITLSLDYSGRGATDIWGKLTENIYFN